MITLKLKFEMGALLPEVLLGWLGCLSAVVLCEDDTFENEDQIPFKKKSSID